MAWLGSAHILRSNDERPCAERCADFRNLLFCSSEGVCAFICGSDFGYKYLNRK